uniref:Uncharacterized protein n=1 Tax=Brassica campestris TaxID=3711 RepID=A0A3P5YW57_BRACM|nr:unnamed protein product [Brassica rapa]
MLATPPIRGEPLTLLKHSLGRRSTSVSTSPTIHSLHSPSLTLDVPLAPTPFLLWTSSFKLSSTSSAPLWLMIKPLSFKSSSTTSRTLILMHSLLCSLLRVNAPTSWQVSLAHFMETCFPRHLSTWPTPLVLSVGSPTCHPN